MELIKLESWSVRQHPDNGYTPPEMCIPVLVGIPDRHPHKPYKDVTNKKIRTSQIISSNGRKVTTRSGTVYLLGKVDPEYRKYLRKISPNWDYRKPVTVNTGGSDE